MDVKYRGIKTLQTKCMCILIENRNITSKVVNGFLHNGLTKW